MIAPLNGPAAQASGPFCLVPGAGGRIEDRSHPLHGEYDLSEAVTPFAKVGGVRTDVERLPGTDDFWTCGHWIGTAFA